MEWESMLERPFLTAKIRERIRQRTTVRVEGVKENKLRLSKERLDKITAGEEEGGLFQ